MYMPNYWKEGQWGVGVGGRGEGSYFDDFEVCAGEAAEDAVDHGVAMMENVL